MEFAKASRFADDHDVVLVGYRGVDGSVRLDCPEVVSALKHSTDLLGETSFRAYGDAFRACADRLTDDGVDLAGYGLPQQVEDLEAARVALGYDRIDLVSESAGTRTAMIYAWEHPESIHRSVMIAVNPPGHFLWDGPTTDEQIARYAELCSQGRELQHADGRPRGDDEADGRRHPRPLVLPADQGRQRPRRLLLRAHGDDLRRQSAPLSAPMTLGSWLAAADGDASGFWFQSLLADLAFPEAFVWGQMAAAARLDARAATDSFSSGSLKPDSNLGDAATAFTWGGGRLADSWPAAVDEDEYRTVRASNVETLLIGGEVDFATPPQAATEELLPHLPNGRQVVLPGFGHSTTFWTDQPEAGTHLINTYLASGKVDDSRYEPQAVDFTPEVTQTALGKGIGGAMVGLALLVCSRCSGWPSACSVRGGFGRKASAVLRSVYPVVLGLGGWFVGVLIVITTMPGVPLDDELLAVLSIGVPIGLGISPLGGAPRQPEAPRLRGGDRKCPRRRLAGLPRKYRSAGAPHGDPRSHGRGEPGADRFGRVAGPRRSGRSREGGRPRGEPRTDRRDALRRTASTAREPCECRALAHRQPGGPQSTRRLGSRS